jgi:hypothetical protein
MIAPEFLNRFGGDAPRWIKFARFLSRAALVDTQMGKWENIMAKADMTKVDKVEKNETKIEKVEKLDKADLAKIENTAKIENMARIDKADMTKIDLDAMSIEDLATLRDNASAKLLEKVTARQIELEAEIERLAQYGKQSKKAVASAPVTKPRKGQAKADDVSDTPNADTPVPAAA